MPNLNKWPTNQLAGPAGDQPAINRQRARLRGRGRPGEPGPQRHRPDLPPVRRLGRPGRQPDQLRHRQRGRGGAVLQKAGYTKGINGFFAKGGKDVSITITNPSAYTDYAQVDALVAQQLKAAGIDASFQGQSVDAWNADVATGNFQLTSHWSNGGITPYNLYDNWLDSSLATGSTAHRRLRAAEGPDHRRRSGQAGRRRRRPRRRPRRSRRSRSTSPRTCRSSRPPPRRTGSSTTRRTTSAGQPRPTRTRPGSPRAPTTAPAPAPTRSSSCTSSRGNRASHRGRKGPAPVTPPPGAGLTPPEHQPSSHTRTQSWRSMPPRIAFSTLAFPTPPWRRPYRSAAAGVTRASSSGSSTASSSTRRCPPPAARRSAGPWPACPSSR